MPGTRSAFAERTSGGYFVDFVWNREQLARYGLSIDDVQSVVMSAVGGDTVTTTVEGRERYPVSVRYFRDFRSDPERLERVLVPALGGRTHVPISQLAEVKLLSGPAMLRNEDGMLTGYVYVDVGDRDIGSYVDQARRLVASTVTLPRGYTVEWSGQYEAMARVRERLLTIVPVTLLLVVALLYLNTKSMVRTAIVLLAVPFSAVGRDLAAVSARLQHEHRRLGGPDRPGRRRCRDRCLHAAVPGSGVRGGAACGAPAHAADLRTAVLHGAVKRIRPKFMTVATMFLGLLPIMWATGAGADVMKRVAAPMLGGIFTSFILELLVYPAIYEMWKARGVARELAADPPGEL